MVIKTLAYSFFRWKVLKIGPNFSKFGNVFWRNSAILIAQVLIWLAPSNQRLFFQDFQFFSCQICIVFSQFFKSHIPKKPRIAPSERNAPRTSRGTRCPRPIRSSGRARRRRRSASRRHSPASTIDYEKLQQRRRIASGRFGNASRSLEEETQSDEAKEKVQQVPGDLRGRQCVVQEHGRCRGGARL